MQGSHDALQEGKVPPESGTALVSDEPARISPEDPVHTPDDPLHQSPTRASLDTTRQTVHQHAPKDPEATIVVSPK